MHVRPEDHITVAVFLAGAATAISAVVLYLIDNLTDHKET